jgi:hypothetical protein
MEIKTKGFYDYVKNMLNDLYTSNYPKDNVYVIPLVNKKVLGKFKEEINGK